MIDDIVLDLVSRGDSKSTHCRTRYFVPEQGFDPCSVLLFHVTPSENQRSPQMTV